MSALPKYVLLFSQIFGVFPMRYVKKTKNGPSIDFSRMLYLNHLLVVVVLTTMSCLALYIDFTGYLKGQPIRMKNSAYVVNVFLDIISLNFMAVVVFISSAKKNHNIINMCLILEKVDKTLHMKLKNRIVLKFKVLLVYFHTTVLILITAYTLILKSRLKGCLYIFPLMVYYIQTAIYVQFTFIIKSFTKRFHTINDKIKEEIESHTFHHILAKDLGLFKFSSVPERFWSADYLQLLIDLYFQLFEAMNEASAFYSSQLFIVVTSSFAHIIISLYFLLQQILAGSLKDIEIKVFWNSVLWIFTHIAHLVLFVRPCTTLSETASQTPVMVCRLLNKDLNNSVMRKELKSFLLKLLHFDVRFSGMGFFDIHSQILTSIASSVATYLIVMLQFKSDA